MFKRLSVGLLLLIFAIAAAGCQLQKDTLDLSSQYDSISLEEPKMKFTFEIIPDEFANMTSWQMDYPGSDSMEATALIEGQLLTVFGQPSWVSENMENSFQYVFKATAEDGQEVIFTVYNVGVIHIGAKEKTALLEEAVNALAWEVSQAKPTDYARTVYYLDTFDRIDIEVKDGKVTIKSSEISEEKADELFDKWYPPID